MKWLKSQFNKVSYIVNMKGHKNSSGELAEWVIKSHKDNHIISSHKTKEAAEKHLQQIQMFKYIKK